jgi:hypothetical protein
MDIKPLLPVHSGVDILAFMSAVEDIENLISGVEKGPVLYKKYGKTTLTGVGNKKVWSEDMV